MEINKIVLRSTSGDITALDLTQDTAVEDTVLQGYTFHKADGTFAEGMYEGGSSSGDAELVVDRSITEITPDSFPNITSIGRFACADCYDLIRAELEENITRVDDYAFQDCGNLGLVILPDTLEHLGYEAFGGCHGLTEITLPYLEYQEQHEPYALYNAFNRCTNLSVINFHGTLEQWDGGNIRRGLENNLQQMITINCSNGTAYVNGPVGNMIIIYNDDSQVLIPVTKNVYTMDSYGITNIEQIKEIIIPEGVQVLTNEAFSLRPYRDSNSLTKVHLPSSLIEIGMGCFQYCTNLTNIEDDKGQMNTLPSGLVGIGEDAFRHCESLPSIVLPKLVGLAPRVFSYCTNLTTLSIRNEENVLFASGNAFEDSNSLAHIYVPSKLVNEYKYAEFWAQYASIIEADPTEPVITAISIFDEQKNYYPLTYDSNMGRWQAHLGFNPGQSITAEYTFQDGQSLSIGLCNDYQFTGTWDGYNPYACVEYSDPALVGYSGFNFVNSQLPDFDFRLTIRSTRSISENDFTDNATYVEFDRQVE